MGGARPGSSVDSNRVSDSEISEIIDDSRRLATLVDELEDAGFYGIDTEFHRERTYWAKLAFVQIAVNGRVVLVDPLAVDMSVMARAFDAGGVAIIHAGDQDLEIFEQATGTVPAVLFDTQVAAGFCGLGTPSLGSLLRSLLDVKLPKADRLTNWLRRPLPERAIRYAVEDVSHLHDLHAALMRRLDKLGRADWALQECEQLRVRDRQRRDPETAWWKLKGYRQLRSPSRGIAQECAAWRERTAADRDVPPRIILPDLALLGIAERPPEDREQLAQVRGLDGRHLAKGAATQIMKAVASGAELPKDRIRLPDATPGDSPAKPLVSLCAAFAVQVAGDNHLDAALLATRDDIAAFLRGDDDAALAVGWRFDLVGRDVARIAAGEVAIGFVDGALRRIDV